MAAKRKQPDEVLAERKAAREAAAKLKGFREKERANAVAELRAAADALIEETRHVVAHTPLDTPLALARERVLRVLGILEGWDKIDAREEGASS